MTWAKLDDSAPSHPKVLRARPEAAWLWTCGICWSNKHHTDGHIPEDMIDGLSPGSWSARRVRELAGRLVDVGLWHVDEERGGWTIHDYADHQEPALKANAELKKAQARERKRRQRARQAAESSSERHDVTRDVTRDMSVTVTRDGPRESRRDEVRDGLRDTSRDQPRDVDGDAGEVRPSPSRSPDPSRPDPTRSLPTEERATRVRAPGGSSLSGLPDPLKEHETVGGFEHVWRRWTAEGRALGLTMPSHPRGRDYQLVEELERLALDAVPNVVARTRFDALEAFERLVGLAMRRYATQHREDAKRAPWKLGFVVSAWPELTKGAIPKEAA